MRCSAPCCTPAAFWHLSLSPPGGITEVAGWFCSCELPVLLPGVSCAGVDCFDSGGPFLFLCFFLHACFLLYTHTHTEVGKVPVLSIVSCPCLCGAHFGGPLSCLLLQVRGLERHLERMMSNSVRVGDPLGDCLFSLERHHILWDGSPLSLFSAICVCGVKNALV